MMKRVVMFVIILISLSYCSCNRCPSGNNPTDPRISSCFFKVGSYFIYTDTTDQIIDSQYVILYSYKPNSVVIGSGADCSGGDSYANSYNMWQVSYRNGQYYDSINSISVDPEELFYDFGTQAPFGGLFDPSADGKLGHAPLDTPFNNFSVNGNVYATVYKVPNCKLFNDTVPTDLYFAPGYGVVKRVEHRITGNVSWDMIRYHII